MMRIILPFICVLMLSTHAYAATDASARVHPGGVGVVMSGGGAKGLYHIGVLEALEQNGIPIDYVAGTSMGSIVAGLYAAGYSPAQMRELAASGVIKEWLSGRIDPAKYMSYYRQVGQNPTMLNVRLDLHNRRGKKFSAPTNLISATQIDMALTELFTPASVVAKGNFNQLMVPFLCVASDMNARKPVVMRRGQLNEAIRASMAIPLVFKPVHIDSMLLCDGGIYDNFPWKAMDRDFRPSFIVGSICTAEKNEFSDGSNILDQALLLAMQDTDYSLPEGRSVRISRNVGVNMLDFDSAVAVMDSGYADAMAVMPELLEKVKERWTPEQYAARREAFRARCPELVFDDYVFEGLTSAQNAYVRDFMKLDKEDRDRVMPFAQLRDNLFSVLANGDMTMDFPKVTYNPATDRYAFTAKLATKPNFKISVGGNVSSTAFNQAYIGMNYQVIGRVGQQLGADLYLGPLYTWGTFGGRTDFYMWKPLFLDYSFNFSVQNLRHGAFGNVSRIDNTLEVKTSDVFASVGAGMPLTHRSLFSLRANGGHINYHHDSDLAMGVGSDHTRFTFFGLKAEIARNTLDKFVHPRRGSDLRLSGIFVTGRDKNKPDGTVGFSSYTPRSWFGGRFTWDKYFDMPSCKWFSFGFNIDAVLTDHPNFTAPGATILSMPAYTPVPHSRMILMPDFRARRFVAGGVLPTFDLLPDFFFRTGFYVMYRERHDYNPQFVDTDDKDRRVHYIAEASLVYHTRLGPVSLALTKYDLRSWKNMYLTFNFGYAIFAPRGTFY